jgi:hypothetical protein
VDIYDGDVIKFFAFKNKNKVHYILVGGFAVNYHGFNRSTDDLDVWLADTEENRKPFVEASVDYSI